MQFFSIIIIIFIVVAIIRVWTDFSIRKRYEDENYLKKLEEIRRFLIDIEQFDDYVTWKERDAILDKYKSAHNFFADKTNYYSKEQDVKVFNYIYGSFVDYINNYNNEYVKRTIEDNKEFFEIEGNLLDQQQREAIVTDEYSNLVVAGAGSGKTLTILGKVLFLTEIKHIDPEHILLMSYTRKTVEDLNDRLKAIPSSVRATTFHKLGLDIITEYEGKRPNVASDKTLNKVVKEYLRNSISSHPEQVQALVEFIACYSNIPEDYNDFSSAGERFDYYKGSVDYETLKSKVHNSGGVKSTLAGERVRSVEELMIANYLYLNGIKYEYEKLYPYSDFTYHPDFYLTDYDIWLEHFGVDENDEAKWLNDFDSKKYTQEMKSKRRLHEQQGTTLLETYSYYNKQHRLLEELESMLKNKGVKLKRVDFDDVYDAISKDKYFGYQLEDLIISFVNLCKSRDLSEQEIKKIFFSERQDDFMTQRSKLFFTFAFPILRRYQDALDEDESIDFHDMINHAADIVRKKGCPVKYEYIIVDEYQDISYSRFNLMKAIREFSDAKILCVGDDWQSIYRFAGSDISLFSKFGESVGEYKQLLIEQTYRNSQELVDMASKFIQKNPMQIKKQPRSKKTHSDPINFVQYDAGDPDSAYRLFVETVKDLVGRCGTKKTIMALGRHSFDIRPILYEDVGIERKRPGITMDEETGKIKIKGLDYDNLIYTTVHKAKGLQADNVIVLHMENSQYGFPNKLTDDPMLTPLLSEQEDYRFAEERRLFYVAITRTKEEVVLMAPSVNESEFFMELLNDNNYVLAAEGDESKQVNCPWCETGRLVIRRNGSTGEQFLGCSHYPQCNQSYKNIDILKYPMRCRRCGSGFLVKRSGRYGNFLGCTNWKPNNRGCNNTINLNGNQEHHE